MAKAMESRARKKRDTLIRPSSSSSCGKRILPNKYNPNRPNIAIHKARKVSRSRICHPYAKSATERNFNANASSTNPKQTFTQFIQLPDLGICFSHVGNKANNENGKANAIANPNIPIVGANTLPEVETSTKRKPIIGPVQEKDTKANVKAIKNMLRKPVVDSAFESTALLHEDGRVSSNAPKKLAAKRSTAKKTTKKEEPEDDLPF